MFGDVLEIAVGCQQRKSMLYTGRRNQAVNRPGLDALDPATLPQFGGGHVGLPLKRQQWKGVEYTEQAIEILWGPHAIQQLLENIADEKNPIARLHVGTKGTDK